MSCFTKMVVFVGALAVSATASAGLVNNDRRVTISQDFAASGTMTGARNAPNTVEYIKCGFNVEKDGVLANDRKAEAWCKARDASGRELSCTTEDPKLVDVVKAITVHSRIIFYRGELPNAEECSRISIITSSEYLP